MDGQEDDYKEFIEKYDDGKEPDKRPMFYKILVGNYQDMLRFPRDYVATENIEAGTSITLIGPSNHTWDVELRQKDEDVVMTKGWCCFAHEHDLSYGQFLLFKQLEFHIYEVAIFDGTTVEVNNRSHVVNGSGGKCQGIYYLNAKEREFSLNHELQITHLNGIRIGDMGYDALKQELQARHMTTWGSKKDLVARLQVAIVAKKLAANYQDCPDEIPNGSDDESTSGTIVISDSEADIPAL